MPRRSFAMTGDGGNCAVTVERRSDGVCDNKTAFAERLRLLRTRAGVSSKALAEALGISPNAVYNWENGRTRPDISNVPAICTCLGIGISELFLTDAPASDDSPEERELVRRYRALDAPGRAFVRAMLTEVETLQAAHMPRPICRELIALPLAQDALAAGTGDPSTAFAVKKRLYVHAGALTARADYAFRVNGASMQPDFRDGQTVLVEKVEGALRPGEIGAFSLENELYIKEYRPDGLYSRNPAYPPRLFADYAEVRLIGRVLGVLSDEDRASAEEIRLFKEGAQ